MREDSHVACPPTLPAVASCHASRSFTSTKPAARRRNAASCTAADELETIFSMDMASIPCGGAMR